MNVKNIIILCNFLGVYGKFLVTSISLKGVGARIFETVQDMFCSIIGDEAVKSMTASSLLC